MTDVLNESAIREILQKAYTQLKQMKKYILTPKKQKIQEPYRNMRTEKYNNQN